MTNTARMKSADYFQQLNNVLDEHSNALSRNLTIEDNMQAEVIQLDVENNVSKVIKLNLLKRNPILGFLGKANYFEKSEFAWEVSPDKALTVNVNVSWANPPNDKVRCTFVFLGGATDLREAE